MNTILLAIAGGVAGLGVFLLVVWIAPIVRGSLRSRRAGPLPRPSKVVVAIVVGCALWLLTGWPVAGALGAAAVWWAPLLLGGDGEHREQVAGIEAVASWTEMLRDLMAGSSGLNQAIAATASIAPEPLRDAVVRLSEDLRGGRDPRDALHTFAETVDNPTADLVASALATATTRHATDLGVLLGALSESARDQAAMLVKVSAGRARLRTSSRIIMGVTLGMAAFMLVFNPAYLEPFDGFLGQVFLAVIGALWATAVVWMTRMSRFSLGPRVLAPAPTKEAAL
ncbi:type II secretion system F family protein [Nocardiopsis lambiniae]|uniref:Type II secretion system F family protein n=1 Tax=Nocardiopsis lambiniae TaxID=3075539 RepID=A0ABU2MFZ7_9ACTN|nr:type II secretion system F family protein [Nocardiopsis sp. DSM 44743]MDT0331181.1 type II secretion system F family protein [Nocardiopsis sp. DSM 44743]